MDVAKVKVEPPPSPPALQFRRLANVLVKQESNLAFAPTLKVSSLYKFSHAYLNGWGERRS